MKERIERFSRYMEYKGLNDNQVTIQCGLGVGVIGGAKKGKSDLRARLRSRQVPPEPRCSIRQSHPGEEDIPPHQIKNNINP